MSNNLVPSIETLPVELFHRIFDNLDAEIILFSIRPVCRLFRSIVNTYNRYVLDFKSISRSNLYIFCRLIDPGNVITLTLSNDNRTSDQISLFLSLVRLQEFTRLRSLTLLRIDEVQLNFMLKRVNLNFLISFSFIIRKYDCKCIKTTINLLSSTVAQSTFRKLEFDMKNYRMSKISWPINSPIQYLTINNNINIDKLCTILQGSPHLHTLIMSELSEGVINLLTSICFRQLTSLTIKAVFVFIDKLESFLLMTPSLIYLKLIGGERMMDGKRWEQFIQINLPQLDKFEFYFSERRLTKQTSTDLELIIASFRTPFWIEYKKWFVVCEYTMPRSRNVHLYSIPICKSHNIYVLKSKKTSLSTDPVMMNEDSTIMDNINSFSLTLNKSLVDDIQEKKATANHPLFSKVTAIYIQFSRNWPLLSLQSLSVFFDISRIIHMKIYSDDFGKFNQNTWMDMGVFMEQAYNLSSLIILSFNKYASDRVTIQNLHSIVSRHIKHLEIRINDLDQIKLILERCEKLATIRFYTVDAKFSEKVSSWFADNTINTTCKADPEMVAVWLGKKKTQSTEIRLDHKRIKLTDNS